MVGSLQLVPQSVEELDHLVRQKKKRENFNSDNDDINDDDDVSDQCQIQTLRWGNGGGGGRGGVGGRHLPKIIFALWTLVWFKNRGGTPLPPLDPPLMMMMMSVIYSRGEKSPTPYSLK